MRPKQVDAGQAIFREGDRAEAMYRIVEGRVRIRCVSPCGRESLVAVYGAGHFIGSVAVLDGLPRHNDAIAECATSLHVLSANAFFRVADTHPELYRVLAISYAMWMRDHQVMFAGLSLPERLARRLDFLLNFSAEEDGINGNLRIELTQEMLAASIAVSRQAVSKLLQDWQDDGLISYRYGSVVVLDRPRLRRVARGPLN